MKVGDKLKYKGGMNPEYGCYEDVRFDKDYEILQVGKQCIDVQLDNDVKWIFSPEEIDSYFTEPILIQKEMEL